MGPNKEILNARRKKVAKLLLVCFWIVLISGIIIIPFFNIAKVAPVLFKISKLTHLIFGISMAILTFMHIKLEKRWERLQNEKTEENV